jgi:hypothetical protein
MPIRLGGTRNRVPAWNKQCGAVRNEQGHGRLPKSVRCGNALGFRVGHAVDWVCLLWSLPRRPDRCGTPTAVRAGPRLGGSSAHVSSYVDTACNQRCQTTVVRASSKGNRADGGAICRRAGAIEYYPGRKDRQTAPRRLVRRRSTRNRPESTERGASQGVFLDSPTRFVCVFPATLFTGNARRLVA